MIKLLTMGQVLEAVARHPLALLVIKTSGCGVCEAVQHQAEDMLRAYPGITGLSVWLTDVPEAAGHFLALAAPTVILFAEGREVHREARFVRFERLAAALDAYSDQQNADTE